MDAAFVSPLVFPSLRVTAGAATIQRSPCVAAPSRAVRVSMQKKEDRPLYEDGAKFKGKIDEDVVLARKQREKRVTKAAAVQESQNFADAWAKANKGRGVDVWFVIGLTFLLGPLIGLAVGLATGIIPGLQ